MTRVMPRGKFILFEGLDRSGKSTQARKLTEALVARSGGLESSVKQMHFPDRSTGIGSAINAYLQGTRELNDQVIHLLFSANRWELQEEMRRLLDSGVTLVVDRYVYSGIAFSSAKGMDTQWCRMPDVGLIKPDLAVFLDVDPQLAASRSGFGDELYEKIDFQNKVRRQFKLFSGFVSLDASLPADSLHASVLEHADALPDRLPGDYELIQ